MSNDELDKLLALLNLLMKTQEESAMDYAFLAATKSIDRTHIQRLLAFCEKCRTSDENLTDNLERLKYGLESYNLLFGEQASYARDSYWPNFWMGENHWELFIQMLTDSKINKCAELWSRYRAPLSQFLVENSSDFIPQLLRNLEQTIAGSNGEAYKEISDLLERDILPPFFADQNFHYLVPFQVDLVEFFKRASLSLWQLNQAGFPENAFYFCSTFSRIVDKKLESSVDIRGKASK
jgi:hypothetical protein